MGRRFPNILITGTPCTGKTALCEQLVDVFPSSENTLGFVHVNVSQLVKDNQLYTEWDDNLNVPIFDDDLLVNHLDPLMESDRGGLLIDFHSGELFPSEWFDLIIVLRAETHTLFDRLKDRGYSESKINENMEAEIFQIVLDSAREAFDGKVEVWVFPSNSIEEQNQIIDGLKTAVQQFTSKATGT
ncbi:adenylate kinase isoenzyme 6 homolog [Condylostylus longicornis]|uniref:adenylate kinase isoenzyme 6 homolog n=1 Tax=Condylostylus longicornis TaxID=2530218 RepID=UPI00244DC4A7|nr:adenylate kinase isoenzyme 6 homolog [Condylostylus longicornis]